MNNVLLKLNQLDSTTLSLQTDEAMIRVAPVTSLPDRRLSIGATGSVQFGLHMETHKLDALGYAYGFHDAGSNRDYRLQLVESKDWNATAKQGNILYVQLPSGISLSNLVATRILIHGATIPSIVPKLRSTYIITVDVDNNASWTAASETLTLSQISGQGVTPISITVPENTTTSDITHTLTITSGTIVVPMTIVQAPLLGSTATIVSSVSTITMGDTDIGYVMFVTTKPWTASVDNDGLTLSASSGAAGTHELTITSSDDYFTYATDVTLTLAIDGATKEIVIQKPSGSSEATKLPLTVTTVGFGDIGVNVDPAEEVL